jgi:DNA-binding NtrC family response regulator
MRKEQIPHFVRNDKSALRQLRSPDHGDHPITRFFMKEYTVSKFEIAVRLYKSYLITEALERFHGNQSATARNLGLHRNSLRRNIKVLGIKLAEQGPHGVRKPPASVEMPARSSDQREA